MIKFWFCQLRPGENSWIGFLDLDRSSLRCSSSLQEGLKAIRETVLEVISYWESWRELGAHITLLQLQRVEVTTTFKIPQSPRKSLWDSLIWHQGSITIIKGWENSSTRRPQVRFFPKFWSFWWCSHSFCAFSSLWQRGVETAKDKVTLFSSSLIKFAWCHSCSIWRNIPTIFCPLCPVKVSESLLLSFLLFFFLWQS